MTDLNCEITDAVATVTLNRPQARNALSAALRQELRATIARLDDDDTVRAIVLTGADPAFCAGVDLRELSAPGPHPAVGPLAEPFITSRTPLIGAINGAAYTGGLELALACHLLVASERASFADTHARIGFTPGWGLTVLLTEAIGSRRDDAVVSADRRPDRPAVGAGEPGRSARRSSPRDRRTGLGDRGQRRRRGQTAHRPVQRPSRRP